MFWPRETGLKCLFDAEAGKSVNRVKVHAQVSGKKVYIVYGKELTWAIKIKMVQLMKFKIQALKVSDNRVIFRLAYQIFGE